VRHSYTPESMKCDSRASLSAHTFASPCLGHAKAKVMIGSSNVELKARPLSVIPWELGKLLFNSGKNHLVFHCF
jgi:hypothetical protein